MIFPREYAEWTDFWWEKAGDVSRRRVLLVGDSITRSYRDYVQAVYKPERIAVDKLCGSRCAGDPVWTAELDLATGPLNEYRYEVIHLNNGLHGGCNDTKIALDVYKQGVKDIVSVLRCNQPQAKLVLVTSTPISERGDRSFVIDETLNGFVLERNAFLSEYAAENGFFLNDMYALVAGNSDFPQSDGVHFVPSAAEKLGHHVAEYIRTLL